MSNLHYLNTFELKQISGGGPISDWVACRVRNFINAVKADMMRVAEEVQSWDPDDPRFNYR